MKTMPTNFDNEKRKDSLVTFGFDWSLKPFQIFVKFLTGVDLLNTRKATAGHGPNRECCITLISVLHISLMLILNLIYNAMDAIEAIQGIFATLSSVDQADAEVYQFSPRDIFEYAASIIYYVGMCGAFLFATCGRNPTSTSSWSCFWNQIKRIQEECRLLEDENTTYLFRKCRRVATFGIMFAFVDFSMNISTAFSSSFWKENSPEIIFPIYVVISNICYSTSSVILYLLFLLIIWSIELFKLLTRRMQHLIDLNDLRSLTDIRLLKEWKNQHSMVVRLVDLFNECFGPIVTLIISHGFISIISYICMAIASIKDGATYDFYYALNSLCTQFCQLLMIVYPAYLLQSQGSKLLKSVLTLNIASSAHEKIRDLQIQAMKNYIVTQVANSQPIVTASGFCSIDLFILPTLFGTAFTYIFLFDKYSAVVFNAKNLVDDP